MILGSKNLEIMSCLQAGFSVSGSKSLISSSREKGSPRDCSSIGGLQFRDFNSKEIWGKTLDFSDQKSFSNMSSKLPNSPVYARGTISFGKAQKWWEKTLQPNMIEISSAQELVDYLLNGGDRLVIIDFFSPGCGGCKSMHPKICRLAESNPNAIFLTVNYEEHKALCYGLHVHVLPFFRFYRGADGRVCSFSCTNATIKKFRDALAKHGTDRCSIGPAKGLDEKELMALGAIDLISRNKVAEPPEEKVEELVAAEKPSTFSRSDSEIGLKGGNAMVAA